MRATSLLCLALLLTAAPTPAQTASPGLFELRIYTANPGKLAALQNTFRDQVLPLFAQNGIENIFDATVLEGARMDGPDAPNMFVAVLAHQNRAAADRAWAAIEARGVWPATDLLARPVASIFMSPTDFSPALAAPSNANRTFELRKYNTGPDALPRTLEQFRSGLAAILVKNGMTPIACWAAEDKSSFIYLLAHKDRETARASWAAFITDYRPFMTEFNARVPAPAGPRTPDDNRFLLPTDFSPRR